MGKSTEEINGGGETNKAEEGVLLTQNRPPHKASPIPQYTTKDAGMRGTSALARGHKDRARRPVPVSRPHTVSSVSPQDR